MERLSRCSALPFSAGVWVVGESLSEERVNEYSSYTPVPRATISKFSRCDVSSVLQMPVDKSVHSKTHPLNNPWSAIAQS